MQGKNHHQPAIRPANTHERNEETLRCFGIITQSMRERYDALTRALDGGDWSAVRAALEKLGEELRHAEEEAEACSAIQADRLRHSLEHTVRSHYLSREQEETLLTGIDRLLREMAPPALVPPAEKLDLVLSVAERH